MFASQFFDEINKKMALYHHMGFIKVLVGIISTQIMSAKKQTIYNKTLRIRNIRYKK